MVFRVLLLGVFLYFLFRRPRYLLVGALLAIIVAGSLFLHPLWLPHKFENLFLPKNSGPTYLELAVVLGGDNIRVRNKQGEFSKNIGFDRLGEAFKLYQKKIVSKILISGGEYESFDHRFFNEARASFDWLVHMGVPPTDIFIEPQAKNTHENAKFSNDILAPLGVKQFYLVTNAIYMPRAILSFRKYGLDPQPYPIGFKALPNTNEKNLKLLKSALWETAGIVYYFFRDYI